MEACKNNGIKVDQIEYNIDMGWPIDCIYNSIIKYPENKKFFSEREWNDVGYIFRNFTCNKEFSLYVDFSFQVPDAKRVASKIRETGGMAFLAHLYIYPLKDYKEYLDSLVNDNIIDGIEVIHSKFNQEQINYLINYCKEHNLKMSAGTDCHGEKNKKKLGIGYGNMNVDVDLISDWYDMSDNK